jgi:hypothetical protein
VSAAEYAGVMEQVALTIDSELRKDAGLPPINLTTVCIHSKPITEECPECMARWAGKAAFLSQICGKCHKNRANHAWRDNEYWCVGNVNELFDDGIEGESREEFERDRMGQTGEDNARRMRVKSALIGSTSGTVHFAGGKGPHLLRDRKGNTAYCGGPGACEFCERGLPPSGDHHAEQVEEIPWIGGNRDLDPNNPEDVAAWKERDRQAAAMLEPAPQIDPVMFEFLDETRKAADAACGADPVLFKSHVLSSADPKPRIVDTAAQAADVALKMKKPAAKKPAKEKRACTFCGKPLEPWSATTMRCTGCGRNEAV